MKKSILKIKPNDSVAYIVYRTKSQSETVTGAGLTADVQDGTLVISSNGVANNIYGPGQWLTVNTIPI